MEVRRWGSDVRIGGECDGRVMTVRRWGSRRDDECGE